MIRAQNNRLAIDAAKARLCFVLIAVSLCLSPRVLADCDTANCVDGKSDSNVRIAETGHTHRDRYAPANPLAVVHFVKPSRYLASSGETLTISLTLLVSEDVPTISVTAKGEAGVELASRSSYETGPVNAGDEVKVSFDVTVLGEGRRYVNFVASVDTLDGSRLSSYSVPVDVGNIRKSQISNDREEMVKDDEGTRLIILPSVDPLEPE